MFPIFLSGPDMKLLVPAPETVAPLPRVKRFVEVVTMFFEVSVKSVSTVMALLNVNWFADLFTCKVRMLKVPDPSILCALAPLNINFLPLDGASPNPCVEEKTIICSAFGKTV